MGKLRDYELRPGLVVYQDPHILIQYDDCHTNAPEETLVRRKSPFLVLEKVHDGRWLCVPTFTARAGNDDRIPLDTNLKDGHHNWSRVDCYFSRIQFWLIPEDCMMQASIETEFSWPGRRNTYAEAERDELRRIAKYKDSSPIAFRHVGRLPGAL